MSKIKILESTLKSFSGQMYGVQFENGESLTELNQRQLMAIGASMHVVSLDTDLQVTPTQIRRDMQNVGASTLEREKPAAKVNPTAENSDAKQTFEQIYTREDLEAVADKSGVKGVRELAASMSVKGRSIEELIEGVLAIQSDK